MPSVIPSAVSDRIPTEMQHRLLILIKQRIQSPFIRSGAGSDIPSAERICHPRSHKIVVVPDEGIVPRLYRADRHRMGEKIRPCRNRRKFQPACLVRLWFRRRVRIRLDLRFFPFLADCLRSLSRTVLHSEHSRALLLRLIRRHIQGDIRVAATRTRRGDDPIHRRTAIHRS